jgi:hypothetical protein
MKPVQLSSKAQDLLSMFLIKLKRKLFNNILTASPILEQVGRYNLKTILRKEKII